MFGNKLANVSSGLMTQMTLTENCPASDEEVKRQSKFFPNSWRMNGTFKTHRGADRCRHRDCEAAAVIAIEVDWLN